MVITRTDRKASTATSGPTKSETTAAVFIIPNNDHVRTEEQRNNFGINVWVNVFWNFILWRGKPEFEFPSEKSNKSNSNTTFKLVYYFHRDVNSKIVYEFPIPICTSGQTPVHLLEHKYLLLTLVSDYRKTVRNPIVFHVLVLDH